MNELLYTDFYRNAGGGVPPTVINQIKAVRYHLSYRFSWFLRMAQMGKCKMLCRIALHGMYKHYGIEISPELKLGKGFLMIHPTNITINRQASIGDNFTILKGATIGNTKRGKNKGAPTIGNNVYVGLNAVVVGKITIGNDVLIAPNAYCNFDVPDHTIVIGNPGVCHPKPHAAQEYITNPYYEA